MRMLKSIKWPALLGCAGALLAPALRSSHAGDMDTGSNRASSHNGGQPLNLARVQLGARLEVQAAAGSAGDTAATASLLHDDDPLGYPLGAGDTSLIVTLPKIEVLNRFNFLNLTAAGNVTVSVASARPASGKGDWRQVQGPKAFSDADVFTCELGSVEARYVKIDFQIEKSGRIDTFGLFGLRTLSSQDGVRMAAADKTGADKRLLFNYAVSSSQAGVIMVSPGEDINHAQALADGDMGSSFTFKPTDTAPMAVVDLGDTRTLNRMSTSFKAGPGHMDIYLLKDPAQSDTERVSNHGGASARTLQQVIASDFPAGRQPVISTDTGKQSGLTRVSANAGGQSGRYLVMVFHPAGGAVSAVAQVAAVDYKDFKDAQDYKGTAPAPVAATGVPLEVAEITAFGDTPPGAYAQKLTPNFPNFPGGPGTSITISPPGIGTNVPNSPPIFPPAANDNTITP